MTQNFDRHISSFIIMINRTEYQKCNDIFYNKLNFIVDEDTCIKSNKRLYSNSYYEQVYNIMSEWNSCSRKEVIEKLSSLK